VLGVKTFCSVSRRCNAKNGGWISIRDDVKGMEDVYCYNEFLFIQSFNYCFAGCKFVDEAKVNGVEKPLSYPQNSTELNIKIK